MYKNNKIFLMCLVGFFAGITNGLIGAGGGLIVVSALIKLGINQKIAHATTICIIFFTCITSTIFYSKFNPDAIGCAIPFVVWGALGSILGSYFLVKINKTLLSKIFGCFSIWAAFQLLTR